MEASYREDESIGRLAPGDAANGMRLVTAVKSDGFEPSR
jgi:hypothetical protein